MGKDRSRVSSGHQLAMAGGGGLSALVGKQQKQHRKPKSGPAAQKKAETDKKKRGVEGAKQNNPKVKCRTPLDCLSLNSTLDIDDFNLLF